MFQWNNNQPPPIYHCLKSRQIKHGGPSVQIRTNQPQWALAIVKAQTGKVSVFHRWEKTRQRSIHNTYDRPDYKMHRAFSISHHSSCKSTVLHKINSMLELVKNLIFNKTYSLQCTIKKSKPRQSPNLNPRGIPLLRIGFHKEQT